NGRIDVVFDTEGYVFIIEIKRDGSAADALTQIKEKGYDRPYLASGKKIYTIGVNFSSNTKRIEEWILE
ncbi:MAG: PD-(D/E)XK nuclease domain-containing protein, partial [Bacteroidales bacterium]|nr:PD-(D/E)XK nuclease domain-containing protein [Bacteroidales bacterium]